ncbi:MAG: hypothetical protein AB7P14_01355 [Blastocatellales bacterium]
MPLIPLGTKSAEASYGGEYEFPTITEMTIMKIFASLLTLLLLFSLNTIAAEDFTGKWSGTFVMTLDGETRDDVAYMDLKQNGTELTGTAGPNVDKQWTIQKGKITGNKATFEVQSDEPLIQFEVELVDGHLKGNAKAEHQGRTMTAVIDLQRQSD